MMVRTTPDPPVSAVQYHDQTSHVRHRISPHSLDFSRYPAPFKTYACQGRIPLGKTAETHQAPGGDKGQTDLDAMVDQVLARQVPDKERDAPMDLKTVSRILDLSYGVTLSDRARGILFRSVPSAGGLYPCQLYLSIQKMPGVDTGLYYCNTVQGYLCKINSRPLDMRKTLPGRARAGVYLIITGIFYHSAWKYRGRAFRYLLLDAGHLAESVILAARAAGVRARVGYDFDDQLLIQGLDLDQRCEVPLACLVLGSGDANEDVPDTQPFHPAGPGPEPFSPVRYEILEKAYKEGSSIVQSRVPDACPNVFQHNPSGITPMPASDFSPEITYRLAITNRRSRRNFTACELPCSVWAAFFRQVFSGIFSGHIPEETGASAKTFLVPAMICQNLEGMADGLYTFSSEGSQLVCLHTGSLANALAGVCLDQAWIGRAAVNFLFLADLGAVESSLGSRGYRYVMMHAGRAGQRIYLAAEAFGLGCCGVGAMYDAEAAELLALKTGSVLLYAVAAGPVKKKGSMP
ncbi:MAG: SagB family peptide dehydrogenase [Desulfotignum sp.]|jgi:SagB-type dehydrogenase family enzyme|nr:SagB family peptide dehydrogenase [Desulfotignum sp.]